jgi:hypothetical protein
VFFANKSYEYSTEHPPFRGNGGLNLCAYWFSDVLKIPEKNVIDKK